MTDYYRIRGVVWDSAMPKRYRVEREQQDEGWWACFTGRGPWWSTLAHYDTEGEATQHARAHAEARGERTRVIDLEVHRG